MPESIKNRLDRLFAKHHVPFKDGLVDEKEYSKADIKIMFLLKEVNAAEEDKAIDGWDNVAKVGCGFADDAIHYGQWGYNGNGDHSWRNVPKFVYAILHGFPDNIEYNDIPIETLAPYIKKIAWVNLKKGEGAESSNPKDIASHARNNFDIWYEEIHIIKPDVIICDGSTFPIIEQIYLERKLIKESDIKSFHLKKDWKFFMHKGFYYLGFYHPTQHTLTTNVLVTVLKKFFETAKVRENRHSLSD